MHWQALADHIAAEMARRGWTQRDLAEAAGVGTRAVWELLKARPKKRVPRVLAAVEVALGWEPGTGRRILETGSTGEPAPYTDEAEREIWQATSLTEAERRELIEYLRMRRRLAEQAG